MEHKYNSIEEALADLRAGRIILATDDPDRENEGDMICAAEFATQENINFMDISIMRTEFYMDKNREMYLISIREY